MPPTGVICNVTGAMYIGSSINMAKRLVDHAVDKDTNVRLQNAINKYGLENFTFAVVEIFKVDPDVSVETNKTRLLASGGKTGIPYVGISLFTERAFLQFFIYCRFFIRLQTYGGGSGQNLRG